LVKSTHQLLISLRHKHEIKVFNNYISTRIEFSSDVIVNFINMKSRYLTIIGIETHVQIKTATKMFCRCSTDFWQKDPNTHVCPVCLGLPGAMPKANIEAIKKALMIGLALNGNMREVSKFDRKNYFYPDLAKGFQISQYDLPFSEDGWVTIEVKSDERHASQVSEGEPRFQRAKRGEQMISKKIELTRAHLEEDTGKLTHVGDLTLIDFNRSGVPLMEIVTEPVMHSAQEAKTYAQKLRRIVRYLGVSDADMEKGSMRVEPNVSLSRDGKLPGYKVELKNINSFKFVEKAVEFEIKRQAEILDKGETPVTETRGWDENKNKTVSQRTKESASDYRYFPEPDLPAINFDNDYLKSIKDNLPELPDKKLKRFENVYGLSIYDAAILTGDLEVADWYEGATKAFAQTDKKGTVDKVGKSEAKLVANWVIGEVLRFLNDKNLWISDLKAQPAHLAEVLYLIDKGEITQAVAKQILPSVLSTGKAVKKTIADLGIIKMDDSQVEGAVTQAIKDNPKAVDDFKAGKTASLQFLVGQVQRLTRGQADVNLVRKLVEEKLKS